MKKFWLFIFIFTSILVKYCVFQQQHQVRKTTTVKLLNTTSTKLLAHRCQFNTDFECLNKQKCIRLSQVCDKIFDCTDRSDEFNCNFCNQTFINDESERFTIRSPFILESKAFCFYKIVNIKNSTVIGIRLKKFNVGTLNLETGLCEDAWLDIYEDDDYDSKPDYFLKTRVSMKSNRKEGGKKRKKIGRFCGTLYDIYSNYYAHGKVLQILFQVSTTNINSSLNKQQQEQQHIYEFEFDVIFHQSNLIKNLANENSFTHKTNININNENLTTTTTTINSIRRTFYNGVLIDGTQCNRLYNDCYKNNDNNSYACIINSPGFPGIYAKDLQCLFYIRKSNPSETFIIINSYLQIDSKVCLNKNLNKNQYKSYMCESKLVIGSDECRDYLNIYNGPSTSDSMINRDGILAEKVCGNGILPKIITKSDSFLFKFKSSSDGLFANMGFVFYILSEKQYFEHYHNFNRRIFNNDVSNVNELKSIQKLEKLQIQNCDSFKNDCSINLIDDEDSNGHLFSLNQYHMKNFTLKYLLKKREFNSIGIFVENYYMPKCNESYLSIESIEDFNDKIQISKFCNQQNGHQEEFTVNKKLFLIDNNYAKDIQITHYKLNQVFDALRIYDFKIYYEFFNLQWNIFLKNSICDYLIHSDNDTTLIKDHLINPQADIFYKYNRLDCKYKLIAAKNQYIKLIINEISFNNDNCNENIFPAVNETELEFNQKCSKINAKIMIRELDLYFSNDSTVLRACLCKKVNERRVFISQTNYIEIDYSIKISQFGSSNLKQNRFNITYKFMNRNCNSRPATSLSSRGVFEYNGKHGIQKEFLIPGYTRNLLYPGVISNRNYYCKFNIHAPKSSFVYTEFTELQIPSDDCEFDYIKVFSIYKLYLMKLCTTRRLLDNERNFPFLNLKKKQLLSNRNLVVDTKFTNEHHKHRILNCYDATRKLCFLSSDLIHDSNRVNKILDGIPNKISFEIFASTLTNFTFKLRYHFYTLDKESVNVNNINKSNSNGNDECDFKCTSKVSVFNNTLLNICLNKQLRCDGTVDCIYSQDDEHECPRFSSAIVAIIVFSSIIGVVFISITFVLLLRKIFKKDSIKSDVQYKKAMLKT